MAKIPFSKLQAQTNDEITVNIYKNKKNEDIQYEVKQYLPFQEKLDLISTIASLSIDDKGYCNPMKIKLYTSLEMVYAYTNLTFTAKMKEDPFKLYDTLVSSKIFSDIINSIPAEEYEEIKNGVEKVVKNYYDYKNSIFGILDAVSVDYNNLDLNAKQLQEAIGDPENLDLLRSILGKLG